MAKGAPPVDLHGKRILITGAARGIGAGVACALARRGARIALVGLEPGLLREVAGGCGPDSEIFEADVTDRAALEDAVQAAAAHLGGLDVVIANAGVAAIGTVRTIDPDAFERIIDVNLIGVWRTVRAALPHLIASRGYVLSIASLAAIAHAPTMASYAASKAGVEAFSNSLRIELEPSGVDVGVAYFSWIDTDIVRGPEAHPAFSFFRSKLKGPMGKTYPLEDAVDALVAGVERRARTVVAPGWIRALLALRSIVPLVNERDSRAWAPEMVRIAEDEVQRLGAEEASIPEGPAAVGIRAS
jgi:NAD(P)-dependent dehydrogenase (short-subunit alcohol dehydrogenase family)